MSGRSRRWLALIGATVLAALLRPPPLPAKRLLDRPPKFSWPWHKATKEALLGAEEALQLSLHGGVELNRPSDPDQLAVLPGVRFVLHVTEPDAFELVSIDQDPVCVDVTRDTATTFFVARIRVRVHGVEIAGRERHTHRWTQHGHGWRLTEADVAVFTDVP